MKFNAKTLQVLDNYAEINHTLLFPQGNVISTMSGAKKIWALSQIDEEISHTFAIHNLSRFIGIVKLFEKPKLTVNEDQLKLTIEEGDKIAYIALSPVDMIEAPTTVKPDVNVDYKFFLAKQTLSEIHSAASSFSHPHMQVVGEHGKLILETTNVKNPTTDRYTIVVGKTDKVFNLAVNIENLKMLPKDYDVTVSLKGMFRFKVANSDLDLEYYVPFERTLSKLNGRLLESKRA